MKLSDFGLAPPVSAIGMTVPDSMSPTRTASSAMATPTAAMPYQAPEQISGKETDSRTDLFALGAILYEMAAGKPAFEGKTQALLIAAITSIDPESLSTVQPLAPPELEYIVKRCLAKAPQKRLQTAWDLLCQLRWITDGSGGSPAWTSTSPKKKRERLFRIALAAAGLVVLVLTPLAYLGYRNAPTRLEARYVLTDLGFMRPAGGGTVYISPNGHWLITSRIIDDPGLDVMAMDSVTKQSVLTGMAIYTPFWKPDSAEFAFWSDGKLKRASPSGGPATNVVDVPAPFGGGSWSSSGVIVYGSAGTLYRVLDVGGESTAIAKVDTALGETEHVGPSFLPDGRHFLYLAVSSQPENSAIYVGSLDSPDRTRLFSSQSKAIYAAPGYILFNRGDVVYAYSFDEKSLKVQGEPVRVADGVPMIGFAPGTPLSGGLRETAAFAVSQTGILSYRLNGAPTRGNAIAPTGDGNPKSLVWIGGQQSGTVVGPDGTYAGISLSPDGKRIAVHRHEGSGGDIWLYDPDQGGRMQRWTTNVSQETRCRCGRLTGSGSHSRPSATRNGESTSRPRIIPALKNESSRQQFRLRR